MADVLSIATILLSLFALKTFSLTYHRGLQFDVEMQSNPLTPHIKVLDVTFPEMNQFTVCLWLYPENDTFVPISYAVSGKDNEILISMEKGHTTVVIGQTSNMKINKLPSMNEWTHICFGWTSNTGLSRLTFNGKLIGKPFFMKKGYTVSGKGVFIIGQDQDSPGSRFDPKQGLNGRVTELHFWNKLITADIIKKMSQCSGMYHGNIVDWRNTKLGLDDYASPRSTTLPCVDDIPAYAKPCPPNVD